jgi:hypothetical protein
MSAVVRLRPGLPRPFPIPPKRQALGPFEGLSAHWRDRTNAERMNHWIDVLLRNHRLVQNAIQDG